MAKTKVGAYVDEDVWERFGEWVQNEHDGRTQNVKGLELEKALEAHMSEDPLSEIHNRLEELDNKGDDIQDELEDLQAQVNALITLMQSGSG